ncbi:hypothetical protein Clacol_003322 [Clathrus columnatus]|uniref:AMP-dependent synthetase/ligase domain-containing protein n=1 Tax=Clathrus columnatus TaxID=1419009 RepID=A0AAV5AAZ7_9AGAM|nr:hypothetical protein Clacol_003322 [Clathrus columnatus]
MSYRYLNHLTAIEEAARTNPNNVAFKVPMKHENKWKDVSYKEFWDDVTRAGVYWSRLEQFITVDHDRRTGARKKEVVGLWYYLFSLCESERAGYITQSIATYVKDVDIVQSLFQRSGAKIVLCDINHVKGWEQLEKAGIKVLPLLTDEEVVAITKISSSELNSTLPPLDGDEDEVLFIQQTSGSSSGRPKLVPLTRRWVDASVRKCRIDKRKMRVYIRSGSFCYSGPLYTSLRIFLHAYCTVLTPSLFWKADELADIITRFGVTDMTLYSSLASDVIQKAKTSALLTETVRTLDSFIYVGGPLNERDIEWAKEMGIKIVCRFASTEVGPLLFSEPGEPHLLRFFHTFDYQFIPVDGYDKDSKFKELVILPTSPDCPVPALRDPVDGKYHTKDLFESVGDGVYISRGRVDDMIITESASNCDARYIEDQIRYLCHDIISIFTVVGEGRPSPALLVEPPETNTNTSTLHETLSKRLESLNSAKVVSYAHERLKPQYIIVVPKGSLPISPVKGTVIRSKAELMFKELLDRAYFEEAAIFIREQEEIKTLKTGSIVLRWNEPMLSMLKNVVESNRCRAVLSSYFSGFY